MDARCDLHRRACLLASVWIPTLVGLPACSRASFQSLEVTDATYAREFHLSDPDGRVRTLTDFQGQVVLLFFGFTQCPDVCPTALTRAARVEELLGAQADKLQVIFVTIDPERDSAAVLRAYTHAFHPGFLGLRSDEQTTRQAAQDFKIFYAKVPTGSSYTMDHTAITYAFDPRGKLRLAIKHTQSAESVAADVRLLLKDV